MQVRSITLGLDAEWPLDTRALARAADFLERARAALERAGFGVQTTRLCTQEAHRFLAPSVYAEFARALDAACGSLGVGYCAVGGLSVGHEWTGPAIVEAVVDAICSTERAFASVHLARGGDVSFAATRAAAQCIARIAAATPQGFGNLRFAAIANCPPGIPFFPAAYHAGGPWRFSLALQAADLAVEAFGAPGTLQEVEDRLATALEALAAQLEPVLVELEALGPILDGVDLSPAPFPSEESSVAAGLEALGVERFGGAGTVMACWLLTRALRRARARRTGFSGAMLPVLEDSRLARRASEGLYSVAELLLYSAVCGTGLDTVPLPGDTSQAELEGILLDVAALSTALDKPLTARLLPVPGARAGDQIQFDFPYFAGSRVLATKGFGAARLLDRGV